MNRLRLFFLCCCLTGCASEPTALKRAEPRVRPELVLLVPDQPTTPASAAPSRPAHLPDQSAILIAPDVIAYPLAARVDPNHPDLMYAGTWAFRKTSAQWRLDGAPAQTLALGPVSRDDRAAIKPLQNQELTSAVLEQRASNDQNRQAITRLIHLQEELQKQLADLRARTSPSPLPSTKQEDDPAVPPRPALPPEPAVKDPPRSERRSVP